MLSVCCGNIIQSDELVFDEKGDSMKKTVSVILLCLIVFYVCAGCGKQRVEQEETLPMAAIGNPWSDWDSMEEAEAAIGFSFGLPEVIAGSYTAVSIRTMNSELIQVVYRDESSEVCVRKQKGEGQDISGDYNKYETCTEEDRNGAAIMSYRNSGNNAVKQLISCNGYSWSLVALDGFWGDSNGDFVNKILEQ